MTEVEQWQSGEKVQEFQAHGGCISSCALIKSDTIILSASHDTKIALWNASTGRKIEELCGHQHAVVDCRAHKGDENRLLSASWDKSARMWDINNGKQLWMGCHESLTTSCDFQHSHQPNMVIVGLEDGCYQMWDTRTERPVKRVNAHSNSITCCRVAPNGLNVCTCSMDQTAAVWDIRTDRRLLSLSGHINVVSSCAFSHNSHFLVTCSWDKTLQVYDVAIGNYRVSGPVALLHHNGCVSACDFSRDSSLLVSCGFDMQVNVWNMNNYQLINSYKGHNGWIKDVKFGKSRKWAVSCDKNGVVKVWNTEAGSQHYNKMVKFKDPSSMELIKCEKCEKMFSPAYNSKILFAAGGNGVRDCVDGSNNDRDISSSDQHVQQYLCVFCRLKDPSRTLDQISNHFLQQ